MSLENLKQTMYVLIFFRALPNFLIFLYIVCANIYFFQDAEWVWVPHEKECFVAGRVSGRDGRQTICETESGEV